MLYFLGKKVEESLVGKKIRFKSGVETIDDVDADDPERPVSTKERGWFTATHALVWVEEDKPQGPSKVYSEGTFRSIKHPGASPIEEGVVRALLGLSDDEQIISKPGVVYILTQEESK